MSPIYRFDSFDLDTDTTRDISADVLDADGRIRVLPASFWAATTAEERALFGNRHGISTASPPWSWSPTCAT